MFLLQKKEPHSNFKMKFKKQLKKAINKQKGLYQTHNKTPTIGERALNVGNKIKKLPKNPRFKKIRKKGIQIRGNINYYFNN